MPATGINAIQPSPDGLGDDVNWKFLAIGAVAAGFGSISYALDSPAKALEKEIGGWVPGVPQRCIDMRFITGSRALGDSMLFKVHSSIKYQTPTPGCPPERVGRTLVTNPSHNNLCKGDTVGLVDLQSGIDDGACQVGEFTPYRRK